MERPHELLSRGGARAGAGRPFAGSTSQLEAFHSRSIFNWTPYGFTVVAEDAGLEVVELRPVIDGLTLVAWRALGLPRFFHRWWARESPRLPRDRAGRPRGPARRPHAQPDQARPRRTVRLPGKAAVASSRDAACLIALAAALALPASAAAAEPQWRVHAEASGSYRLDYGNERDASTARPRASGLGDEGGRLRHRHRHRHRDLPHGGRGGIEHRAVRRLAGLPPPATGSVGLGPRQPRRASTSPARRAASGWTIRSSTCSPAATWARTG